MEVRPTSNLVLARFYCKYCIGYSEQKKEGADKESDGNVSPYGSKLDPNDLRQRGG